MSPLDHLQALQNRQLHLSKGYRLCRQLLKVLLQRIWLFVLFDDPLSLHIRHLPDQLRPFLGLLVLPLWASRNSCWKPATVKTTTGTCTDDKRLLLGSGRAADASMPHRQNSTHPQFFRDGSCYPAYFAALAANSVGMISGLLCASPS